MANQLAERIQDISDLNPWLSKRLNGTGALGMVAFNSPVRYRGAIVRDFVSFYVPEWVAIHGAHAIVYRATGFPVSAIIDGHISMDGAGEKPDRSSRGPGAPAARIETTPAGFRVQCRTCDRVHLVAGKTTMGEWAPFLISFGGEIFICPECGDESELRAAGDHRS